MGPMRIVSLVFIISLSLISCRTIQTSQSTIFLWKKSYTGMVSNDKMMEKITDLINSLVNEFLNDCQKVTSEQGAEQN